IEWPSRRTQTNSLRYNPISALQGIAAPNEHLFGRESMTRESMTITNRSTTALLARVTGAVLIAIAFIAIAKTPLSPRTAAQTAAGYRVDSTSADGLYATIFTTPHG